MITNAIQRSAIFDEALRGLLTSLADYAGVEAAMRLRALTDLATHLDTDTLLVLAMDVDAAALRAKSPCNTPMASFSSLGVGQKPTLS